MGEPGRRPGPSIAARRAVARWLAALARRLDPGADDEPIGEDLGARVPFGPHSFVGLLLRRLLIWFVAASVAFYLPLTSAGLPSSLDALTLWQDQLLAHAALADLFAATLAMAILSASDVIDNILAPREGAADAISIGSGWCLIAAYFVFTLYAARIYGPLTTTSPTIWNSLGEMDRGAWRTELHVLWLVLGLSLFGEFIIVSATLKARE